MSEPAEHRLAVRRTARYVTLGGGADVRSVWYVLHGYRQLAHRFIERFREVATPQRLIVAPEALNRFYLDDDGGMRVHGADSPVGATWMTRHDREAEIEDYVAYLDALDAALALPESTQRIVLGFSQGSATAARWATLGRSRVDRLVLWAGALPEDLPDGSLDRLRDVRPVFVIGERDRAVSLDRVEADRTRLGAAGIESALVAHGGGHTVDARAVAEVARVVES